MTRTSHAGCVQPQGRPQGAVLFLLLFISTTPALGERLPLKSYTVSDGLAHNQVNKIVRDSRGFLWFCTADGLSRFDGYGFINYGTDQGLPDPNVLDFLETREGSFWVATRAGLVGFDPKGKQRSTLTYSNATSGSDATAARPMFTVIVPDGNERGAKSINALLEDKSGQVWCGTNNGLYRLTQTANSHSLQAVDIGLPNQYAEQAYVSALIEDSRGWLWIGAPSGLYRRMPDGAIARFTIQDGLPEEYIQAIFADEKGNLWAGTRSMGLFQFAADGNRGGIAILRLYRPKDGLPTGWIFQFFQTSDHKFWIATNIGLIEFDPEAKGGSPFHTYTPRNGLSYREITALAEDAGGNLWLGTTTSGAMKLSANGFITYDSQDGIASTNAIMQDRSGALCFRGAVLGDDRASVFEGGKLDALGSRPAVIHTRLGRLDGAHFEWFRPSGLVKFGWVSEGITLQARNGEWWVGTESGLYRFPASAAFIDLKRARPLAVYTMKDGLAANQIFRLFEDSRGNIWISTISSPANGLARWDASTGKLHDLTEGAVSSHAKELARAFGEDRWGNIWIAFSSGLARYRVGDFRFFTAKDGLPSTAIVDICVDRSGRLWLASARTGLVRVDDPGAAEPSFANIYTTAQGLSSNSISVITEDLDGHIYVGGGRGLDELDPETGRVKRYTTAEGLAPGALLAAFCDTTGELWIGTTQGLSRFHPPSASRLLAPGILIAGIQAGGHSQPVSALGETAISLPAFESNQNQFQIDYVGLGFEPGEVLRYQYKLEGADADWGAATEHRSVTYANLASGRYRFLVRAVNSEGVLSPVPATLEFKILPPVWRRWWFLAVTATLIGTSIYSLYRYRLARMAAIMNMRTRIATDLHDDIGANLTRITLLSEVANQQLGSVDSPEDTPMTSVARIARESVASMSDIVWAIDPERDSLLDLTRKMRQHADEVFTLRDIELRFTAPDAKDGVRLGIDVRRDLLLIFKEAVNNAARHSKCSRVTIDFRIESSILMLKIADDGTGFDPSTESQGQGLRSMKRRAAALGGTLEISTSPGAETIVRVRIPLGRRRRLIFRKASNGRESSYRI